MFLPPFLFSTQLCPHRWYGFTDTCRFPLHHGSRTPHISFLALANLQHIHPALAYRALQTLPNHPYQARSCDYDYDRGLHEPASRTVVRGHMSQIVHVWYLRLCVMSKSPGARIETRLYYAQGCLLYRYNRTEGSLDIEGSRRVLLVYG